MAKQKKFICVDAEKILDYVQGECCETDMFKRNRHSLNTANTHNKSVYRNEFEEYIREWNDENYGEDI